MKLREYQVKTIQAMNNATCNSIVNIATGGGKTVIFTEFVKDHQDKNIVILVDRLVLKKQIYEYIDVFNNYTKVYTIQSYKNIMVDIKKADYIIIDEAHMVNYKEGKYKEVIEAANENCIIFGFSATPYRPINNYKNLEPLWGENKLFKKEIAKYTYKDLLNKGYLMDIDYLTDSTNVLFHAIDDIDKDSTIKKNISDSVKYKKLPLINIDSVVNCIINNKVEKAIIFAVNVEHANHIDSNLKKRGYKSDIIEANLDKNTIEKNISNFKEGKIAFLVNVDMLTKGFDYPKIENLICLRPTQSIILWHQICGRLARIEEGKKTPRIFDFVGNYNKFNGLDSDLLDYVEAEKPKKAINKDENQEIRERSNELSEDIIKLTPMGDLIKVKVHEINACDTVSQQNNDMIRITINPNSKTNEHKKTLFVVKSIADNSTLLKLLFAKVENNMDKNKTYEYQIKDLLGCENCYFTIKNNRWLKSIEKN